MTPETITNMISHEFIHRGYNYILTNEGTLYRWELADKKKAAGPENWKFTFVAQL